MQDSEVLFYWKLEAPAFSSSDVNEGLSLKATVMEFPAQPILEIVGSLLREPSAGYKNNGTDLVWNLHASQGEQMKISDCVECFFF